MLYKKKESTIIKYINIRRDDNMKVVLAGAYGKLGSEILKELVKQGHEVVATDFVEKEIEGLIQASIHLRNLM